jgi:hypothetical protein
MDTQTRLPDDLAKLSPRERHQKILVREAAKLAGMSETAFRKHYNHLIKKLTPRVHRVRFIDAITLPEAVTAPPPPAD